MLGNSIAIAVVSNPVPVGWQSKHAEDVGYKVCALQALVTSLRP